jgi:hypothetical protein
LLNLLPGNSWQRNSSATMKKLEYILFLSGERAMSNMWICLGKCSGWTMAHMIEWSENCPQVDIIHTPVTLIFLSLSVHRTCFYCFAFKDLSYSFSPFILNSFLLRELLTHNFKTFKLTNVGRQGIKFYFIFTIDRK